MLTQPNITAEKLDEAALKELLTAANGERREDPRHPLFAPVSLCIMDQPGLLMSAFSREISCSGIGLLHVMPIEKGQVGKVSIKVEEKQMFMTAECVWCRPVGDGWFLSGWRFVRVS